MSPRNQKVLSILEMAANKGKPCPSNPEIAIAIGAASKSAPVDAMNGLERAGLITVDRGNNSRVVTINSTGAKTAGSVKSLHWRSRPEYLPRKGRLAELVSNGVSFGQAGIIMHRSRAEVEKLWSDIRADLGWQAV